MLVSLILFKGIILQISPIQIPLVFYYNLNQDIIHVHFHSIIKGLPFTEAVHVTHCLSWKGLKLRLSYVDKLQTYSHFSHTLKITVQSHAT